MADFDDIRIHIAMLLEGLDLDPVVAQKAVATPETTLFSDLPVDSKDVLMLAKMLE